jgi:hypothetical protein
MISNITAMIIQTREDIICTSGYSEKDKKYVGWITLGEESRYRPLLNTEPKYDTAEEAVVAMKNIVEIIRSKR